MLHYRCMENIHSWPKLQISSFGPYHIAPPNTRTTQYPSVFRPNFFSLDHPHQPWHYLMLNTKVHDLDLNNHRILIYESDKTGVGRVAYYSDDAREALVSWLQVRNTFKEYFFYGRGSGPLCY